MSLTEPRLALVEPSQMAEQLAVVIVVVVGLCAVLLLGTLLHIWDELLGGERAHRTPSRPHRRSGGVTEAQRRIGEQGELLVAGILEDAASREHCYVFNNLREPSAGDIDHLLVGPGGVTIVETKANGGTLSWDGHPDSPILINGEPMKRDPMAQMERQTQALERRFSYRPKSEGRGARPLNQVLGADGKHWMWCFTRATLPGNLHADDPHLASPKNLVAKILSRPALFSADEIDYIAGRIGRAYAIEPDASPSGLATSGAPIYGNATGAAPGARDDSEDRVHGAGPRR